MAHGTGFDLDLQGMRIVTTRAGIDPFHMAEFAVIGFAIVLVTTHRNTAIQRGSGGVVVNVAETKGAVVHRRWNGVGGIRSAVIRDLLIHAHLRLTPLMAFHAAAVITCAHGHTGGEGDIGLGQSDGVMAGHALNAKIFLRRNSDIHGASRRTIGAQEILVTLGAVAFRAGSGHFRRVFLIPVTERFGVGCIVSRAFPGGEIGHFRRGLHHDFFGGNSFRFGDRG